MHENVVCSALSASRRRGSRVASEANARAAINKPTEAFVVSATCGLRLPGRRKRSADRDGVAGLVGVVGLRGPFTGVCEADGPVALEWRAPRRWYAGAAHQNPGRSFMSVSRRTSACGCPVTAAAVAMPASAQTSTATGASSGSRQAPGFYRYKVGDIEITAVHDGSAPRPLENFVRNADIAEVRKAAEEAFVPTDAYQNTFTPMVLRSGGKTILIDTGLGDVGAPTTGLALTNLRAAGFDPARIDTVLISHFHGDHISGLRLKNGTAVYPNAEIMVPAAGGPSGWTMPRWLRHRRA